MCQSQPVVTGPPASGWAPCWSSISQSGPQLAFDRVPPGRSRSAECGIEDNNVVWSREEVMGQYSCLLSFPSVCLSVCLCLCLSLSLSHRLTDIWPFFEEIKRRIFITKCYGFIPLCYITNGDKRNKRDRLIQYF